MSTTEGRFRLRQDKDGAIQLWARGSRLEMRVLALVPVVFALAFLISPAPLLVRLLGAVVLLACALITVRLTNLGLRLTADGVEIVDVLRTQKVSWDEFAGFMGERTKHEGRCVVLCEDGRRVQAPGTFDLEEMDPSWDVNDEPVVDELNSLVGRLRRGEAIPV